MKEDYFGSPLFVAGYMEAADKYYDKLRNFVFVKVICGILDIAF